MSSNIKKCKVVHFSRTKSVVCQTTRIYSLAGQQIDSVSSILDLGITITNDLSWVTHIENVVSTANRTIGLVKRLCRDLEDVNTRKLLYCSIVRPKLEYSSNLWSPYTIKH